MTTRASLETSVQQTVIPSTVNHGVPNTSTTSKEATANSALQPRSTPQRKMTEAK